MSLVLSQSAFRLGGCNSSDELIGGEVWGSRWRRGRTRLADRPSGTSAGYLPGQLPAPRAIR